MVTNGPHVKTKIGSHLSYPIKFAELSESVSPAVEQLGIEVWFWAWKPPRRNETRESYPVVEARYSPRREPGWQIYVSPIPRALRSSVRPLLLPMLSGRFRSWLLAERVSGWYSTDHALRVWFASGSQELEFDEHNAA